MLLALSGLQVIFTAEFLPQLVKLDKDARLQVHFLCGQEGPSKVH
jgi:hypothetical protein